MEHYTTVNLSLVFVNTVDRDELYSALQSSHRIIVSAHH